MKVRFQNVSGKLFSLCVNKNGQRTYVPIQPMEIIALEESVGMPYTFTDPPYLKEVLEKKVEPVPVMPKKEEVVIQEVEEGPIEDNKFNHALFVEAVTILTNIGVPVDIIHSKIYEIGYSTFKSWFDNACIPRHYKTVKANKVSNFCVTYLKDVKGKHVLSKTAFDGKSIIDLIQNGVYTLTDQQVKTLNRLK